MEKIRSKRRERGKFPGVILVLCGFLAGNILPDVLWKLKWQQKTMASVYLISTFIHQGVSGTEYLKEILKFRGSIYILTALCGFSVFGVPLAVAEALLLGVKTGTLMSMSVLQFGFAGGLVGLGLLMPQYLIYVPVTLFLLNKVWELSYGIWKNKGLFPEKCGWYLITIFWGALIYSVGILMECYLNPWITEKILNFVKIF